MWTLLLAKLAWYTCNWVPPLDRDVTLETYLKAIQNDIVHGWFIAGSETMSPRQSHSSGETGISLYSLRTRADIVIKKADTGSATVVMSREDYVSEVIRHLDNGDHYHKLDDEPTGCFGNEIQSRLPGMVSHHAIERETMMCLLSKDVKASGFYILP